MNWVSILWRKTFHIDSILLRFSNFKTGVTYIYKGTNEEFITSALSYVEETLLCAEIVKLLPKRLAP